MFWRAVERNELIGYTWWTQWYPFSSFLASCGLTTNSTRHVSSLSLKCSNLIICQLSIYTFAFLLLLLFPFVILVLRIINFLFTYLPSRCFSLSACGIGFMHNQLFIYMFAFLLLFLFQFVTLLLHIINILRIYIFALRCFSFSICENGFTYNQLSIYRFAFSLLLLFLFVILSLHIILKWVYISLDLVFVWWPQMQKRTRNSMG